MDLIKNKAKAIDELNKVLDNSESAKRVAQDLDDMIFDYVSYQACNGRVMSHHETDIITTVRLVRDFFFSLQEAPESIKPK